MDFGRYYRTRCFAADITECYYLGRLFVVIKTSLRYIAAILVLTGLTFMFLLEDATEMNPLKVERFLTKHGGLVGAVALAIFMLVVLSWVFLSAE